MWKLSPTKEMFPLVEIKEIASFSAIEEISAKAAKVAKVAKMPQPWQIDRFAPLCWQSRYSQDAMV
jgi:hypothetical protein